MKIYPPKLLSSLSLASNTGNTATTVVLIISPPIWNNKARKYLYKRGAPFTPEVNMEDNIFTQFTSIYYPVSTFDQLLEL